MTLTEIRDVIASCNLNVDGLTICGNLIHFVVREVTADFECVVYLDANGYIVEECRDIANDAPAVFKTLDAYRAHLNDEEF